MFTLQIFQKVIKNESFCRFLRIKTMCSNIKQEKLK